MSCRKKIIITGGSGRIGEVVIKELKKEYDVIVFDIKEPSDKDVEFFEGNINDYECVNKVTKEADIVIHLAGYPNEGVIPSYTKGWDINCTGTFNVFETSVVNKVKKVIFASSICATGVITWVSSNHSLQYFPVDEKHSCKPEDLYGVGKFLGEKLSFMYAQRSSTSFINLRLATVWLKSEEIDEITRSLIKTYSIMNPGNFKKIDFPEDKKKKIYLIKDPTARLKDLIWQFVDVRDVAQAFRLAVEKDNIKYGVYNIGANTTPSIWDSIKIAQYFYPGVPIKNKEEFLKNNKAPLWDITKAKKELGYNPVHNWAEYYRELK